MQWPTNAALLAFAAVHGAAGNSLLLEPDKIPGCQFPTLTSSAYIYFIEPASPAFLYSIETPWTDTYGDILRSSLKANGFNLTEKNARYAFKILCDWKKLDSISVAGIRRGDIAYKQAHIVDRRLNEPSNETVNQIRNVLLANAPYHDVGILMMEIGIPTICLIAALTFICWYARQRVDKLAEDQLDRDIELSNFKSRSASDQTAPPQYEPPQLELRRVDSAFGSLSEPDHERVWTSSSHYTRGSVSTRSSENGSYTNISSAVGC